MSSDSGSHSESTFKLSSQAAFIAAKKYQIDLASDEEWTVALHQVSPVEPKVVLRLDRPDDLYYIVEFMKGSRIAARMGIGGDPYPLLRVNGIRSDDSEISPFVAVSTFLADREGHPWGRGAARDRVVRPEVVSVHPLLAWKPCAQSRSPLLPFYLLTVGDVVYYLRVDGELFTALTKSQPGR